MVKVLYIVTLLEIFAGVTTATAFTFNWNPLSYIFDGESKVHIIEQLNKNQVLNFYQEVFGDKNVDAADKYIDETTYIQHNPNVPDGREAFKAAFRHWFEGAPKEKIDFKRVSAENNLVWVHTKSVHGEKVESVIDIFRLEDLKIVEHWDVIQPVPRTAKNDHPMF